MIFNRDQVNAAKKALGLPPDDTARVFIHPDSIYVEVVARGADGHPSVANGLVAYRQETIEITENKEDA